MSSVITKLTIAEFERMVSAGVFDPHRDHTIELIYGELRDMSPIGYLHLHLVNYLNHWSHRILSDEVVDIFCQQPVSIPELDSVPQPDVAWLKPNKRFPRPIPEDVFLIVEVSETSLEIDRGEKAELYAAGGISDYWIVNIAERCVEVYREPKAGVYTSVQSFKAGSEIHPLAFPELSLSIDQLFAAAR
jgi:Uma2 family endonuclease